MAPSEDRSTGPSFLFRCAIWRSSAPSFAQARKFIIDAMGFTAFAGAAYANPLKWTTGAL